MDFLTILGVLLGFGAIIGGNMLEGGHIDSLINGPALVIVLGGTIGATLVQAPPSIFFHAMRILPWVIFPRSLDLEKNIKKIINWSNLARREGLLGLENLVATEPDPLAKKGLQLLVDGNEPEVIRDSMELDLVAKEQKVVHAAKVFEAMGGYSPTIGIIGAVMGLIHVMQNLGDPSKLGSGIATAFVATIYGVGLANLIFLPIASKLKTQATLLTQYRELIVEGIISIAEGENPRNIEVKLSGYLH